MFPFINFRKFISTSDSKKIPSDSKEYYYRLLLLLVVVVSTLIFRNIIPFKKGKTQLFVKVYINIHGTINPMSNICLVFLKSKCVKLAMMEDHIELKQH